MRIQKVRLFQFKRFDDLTIDLGAAPAKIVAMLGPNGCGKSSVFDAFEQRMQTYRNKGRPPKEFYSKALFSSKPEAKTVESSVSITPDTNSQAAS